MKEIASNIYVSTEYALVTVGAILSNAGWVCVDTPPHPHDAQAWLDALHKIANRPILYVINTDHHRDRIVGNAWFKAPVIAHTAAARQMLALGNPFIAQAAEELSADDNELVQIASVKVVPPQISYTNSLIIEAGNRQIELFSRPSATLGSTWVMLKDEKVIFAGDSIAVSQHPYISDGASKAWLDALRLLRLERNADMIVVPGREKPTTPAATDQLSEYLRVARRRMNSLVYAERPRSEIGQVVPEFLAMFPYPSSRREAIQRRVKAGLEAIYEEMRSKSDDDGEGE